MSKNKVIEFKMSGEISADTWTELLRSGVEKLIIDAVEVELQQLFNQLLFLKMSKDISR